MVWHIYFATGINYSLMLVSGLRSRELTMPVPHHMGCSLPTFQDAHNGNVMFVIGTLDGDPVKLNLLKDYVSKALFTLVNNLAFSSFNIIHFTCEITKWCDRAVICNPETACEAVSWVRNLPCEPGISPVLALSAAFEDTGCQTVYLAIDSLPGNVLQDIYALLARHKDACSVQVVYLVGEPCDSPTQGQFKTVSLHPSGSAKEVTVKGNFIGNNCCNASRFGPLLSPNYSEVRYV
ncbi:uncharacterized protein LOC128664904 [Bombina bombina]|uniref:uncharacterized protein LOC128664904 n=1 Tax=Bombina bombina TaxID=8345 RepID=UPI00235A7DE2|nr:uncharacterized protein LOC128664904 [Bombina bombina]